VGRVALARHGETEFNRGAGGHGESAERVRGFLDVKLDPEGEAEAKRLGRLFSRYDVREVYVSPLTRARVTGEQIAAACGAPLHVMASLLPWNLGAWQGEAVKDVIDAMRKYTEQEHLCVPGGEPFCAYRQRFLSFLSAKCTAAREMDKDEFLVLVTHSRGLQITKAWAAAGYPEDLSIDVERMNDYSDETNTGGTLMLSWPEVAA
jgi:broad specificity phosphatase PhoE